MKKKSIILLLISIILFSCNTQTENKTNIVDETSDFSKLEHLVMSVVWFQKSAEMRACYYQTFNIAKMLLTNHLNEFDDDSKLPAVIVDVDETILDNSPFEVECIRTGEPFSSESWKKWTDMSKAKPLPGALDFAKFAESKNVEVFYVSNRKIDELETTMANLKDLGFPYADEKHLLFKHETSDKTERRAIINGDYEVLLLIGDNLRDFDEIFKQRDDNLGFSIVDDNKELFGNKFLILPNPMYGEWEKAVYGGSYPETSEEKTQLRKEILEGY